MTAIQMAHKANTFFGLTTVSKLTEAQSESITWKAAYLEANETIERFNQENKALKKSLAELTTKHDDLKQELKECRIWANHLEETNKEATELIAKQQESITLALNEAAQTAMLRNEVTVELATLKRENQRFRGAIQMAIDNLNLDN